MWIINYSSLCVYLLFYFFMEKAHPWSSFKSSSPSEWRDKILKDLKGKPIDSLTWNTTYGRIDPTEISDHFNETSFKSTEEISWEFNTDLALNTNILEVLNNGANSIYLNNIPFKENIFSSVMNDIIHTHVNINELSAEDQYSWVNWAKENDFSGSIRNTIHPSHLLQNDFVLNSENLKKLNGKLEDHIMNCLFIDGDYFSNRIFEIDYELAWLCSYLNELIEYYLINKIVIPKKIIISTSLGTTLFENIAKIKSLIVLANTIIKVHNLDCAIEIETSFNQVDISPIEKEHHILRLTVACMSSTLSGSKRFKLGSKDAIFDGDYWNKIACNIPIILKEESYLFSDIDATKGCYIINQLEKKLADSSWSKFKMIESNGGFRSTNNKKQFNEIVEENCKKRLHALKENKKMIIGFNAFSTAEDQIQFNHEMKTPLYLQDLIS